MTVYFAKANNLVKIGHAEDVQRRLAALAASFIDGIELVAQCDGGKDVEAAFHAMFSDSKVEGEWFANSPLMEATISKLAHNVGERRFFGGQPKLIVRCVEANLAKALINNLFEAGLWSVSKNLEAVYHKLAALNPEWSRRRVRSIWNGETRNINFSEVVDLAAASSLTPYQLAKMIVDSNEPQAQDAEVAA
ncbi:GIY-YIG nuclease family protein [Phyllobacterium chamaecytisi]|uniref:GIY-YIG nuclease family protein n=1 Tax=Phyllobacterium chamaecytisi TaxID=2876082 RepID=UPI001CCAB69A|nr:GIY-YIG nuclease family protein [Phyllobacterium sp. KW56]MBZ9600719.1 GIY-YIG nuclease family protein [Phyllobacterium sp. KW56]